MHGHISKAKIERTAQIHQNTADASRALGITPRHYGKLCRQYRTESHHRRKTKYSQGLAKP